jgi:HK97 gp10 family phage protein
MATQNLSEMASVMQKYGELVKTNANKTTRRAAIAIDQAVVMATPVDTGRARSNWQVQINTPFQGERPAYAPGKNLGKGETANAGAAMDQGNNAIGGYNNGDTIYITNNLPYIGQLNAGTSRQSPAGFVNAMVLEAVNAVQNYTMLGDNP